VHNFDDFKDRQGNWVRSFNINTQTEYLQYHTRMNVIWNNINLRVNPGEVQNKEPTYIGCKNNFKSFQEFAEWCQSQVGYGIEGFQLDKDLLSGSSKVYSSETCVFIPSQLNTLLIKRDADRGEYPLGVCVAQNNFMAQCSVGKGRQEYLGVYATPEEAFYAYKTFKENFIKQQAAKWKDKIDLRAYEAL